MAGREWKAKGLRIMSQVGRNRTTATHPDLTGLSCCYCCCCCPSRFFFTFFCFTVGVDGHAGSIKWVEGKKKRRKRKCTSEKDPSGNVLHVITRQ
jgi:hypothetical protein